MKFLTKEWYLAMQRSDLHLSLKPSCEARSFSENYFQQLYAACEQEHLDFFRRCSEINPSDLAAKIAGTPLNAEETPLSSEESEAASAAQSAFAEALHQAEPMQFDPEKEKRQFHARFLASLQNLNACLPVAIREKVADMRVLALDYASPEIIGEIADFCRANERRFRESLTAKREVFQSEFGNEVPAFYKCFDRHDRRILSYEQNASGVVLTFDDRRACRFVNGRVLHCDSQPEGALWLYDELHRCEDNLELHALLLKADSPVTESSLIDLIIQCRDIEVKSNIA